MHAFSFQRRLVLGAAAAGGLVAAGCASWVPDSIEVSRDQLSAALARHFPYTTRWMGIFDTTVAMPRLKLLPDLQRVGAEVDVTTREALLSDRTYRGSLSIDSTLRFEPHDNTLRLADVQVERFGLEGLPFAFQSQAVRFGVVIAQQWLEGAVVHTLDESAIDRMQRAGVRPGEIRITDDGLRVALVPVNAPSS